MICWFFSLIALSATLSAAVMRSMRRATLALWIAGLAMGCIYLTLGAEALAVLQWIVSTLVAISLFFFAAMFGEYEKRDENSSRGRSRFVINRERAFAFVAAAILGGAFAAVIHLGSGWVAPESVTMPARDNDLISLGRILIENHLLSLEVLALSLLMILVGGGVIARPESKQTISEKGMERQPEEEMESC